MSLVEVLSDGPWGYAGESLDLGVDPMLGVPPVLQVVHLLVCIVFVRDSHVCKVYNLFNNMVLLRNTTGHHWNKF